MQIAELRFQLDDSLPVQRILRLMVGTDDVSACIDRIAGELREKVAVPGFRKGKGPLWLVRRHYAKQVGAKAFEELKRAALDQVIKQLKDEDKPFLPPELLEGQDTRIKYGMPLEFGLRYLVDPSGMGKNPEAPQAGFDPMAATQRAMPSGRPLGVPEGPRLPSAPSVMSVAPMPEFQQTSTPLESNPKV
jgi:hypothetical protein